MESLFIEWLTGPFCESLNGGKDKLTDFIGKYPQYDGMKENEIDFSIIDNILPKIDVNSLYKGKRIYHYFIESLLLGNRYAREIFEYSPNSEYYDRFIKYFFNSIRDKEDFLPLLIPDSQIRELCEDKEDLYVQIDIRGVIIGYFIQLDSNFENILKEYIPGWDDINPDYWEDFFFPNDEEKIRPDSKNGFLRHLKFSINDFVYFNERPKIEM